MDSVIVKYCYICSGHNLINQKNNSTINCKTLIM